MHLIIMKYFVDASPTQQAEKEQELRKLLMPCNLGQNPSHHPTRSNRHHLQQPHKELIP